MLRVLTSLIVFGLMAWFALSFIAGDAVEENGGIKATIIELGHDAKDVWHSIAEYDPDGGEDEPRAE